MSENLFDMREIFKERDSRLCRGAVGGWGEEGGGVEENVGREREDGQVREKKSGNFSTAVFH